ncbi:endonuclease domain-containing protein [Sphingomonas sp. PB2P12]|uniref:endonuclease domain-containing protein n=1 Tax=Sphingomonas sandaracina TaxID=3096157 RepID=UPI002FC96CF4
MLQGTGAIGAQAKQLRAAMSGPEIALWVALRDRPVGLKFRKQHPSGPYVADFYCHAARFIIEVDGQAHDFGDRPARDAARDRWFEERGIAVLRIPAIEIFRDCDAMVRGIVEFAVERLAAQEE